MTELTAIVGIVAITALAVTAIALGAKLRVSLGVKKKLKISPRK